MGKQEPSSKQQLHNSAFSKQENTIALKVLIHCEGCKRKVRSIIKYVDGVDSVNIDAENGKVTVVGRGVDVKEVLNSLNKAGKHAEIWQFGGGKVPMNAIQMAGATNNNSNGDRNKMKGVGFEKPQEKKNNNNNNFPKGKGSPENGMHGANYMGDTNKGKGGGDMIELANAGPSFNMLPPPKPPTSIGAFTPSGHFDRPNLPSNNTAILSKSMAPRPSIFHGETSVSTVDNSENATAEYATHLFSDENANSCSVM